MSEADRQLAEKKLIKVKYIMIGKQMYVIEMRESRIIDLELVKIPNNNVVEYFHTLGDFKEDKLDLFKKEIIQKIEDNLKAEIKLYEKSKGKTEFGKGFIAGVVGAKGRIKALFDEGNDPLIPLTSYKIALLYGEQLGEKKIKPKRSKVKSFKWPEESKKKKPRRRIIRRSSIKGLFG